MLLNVSQGPARGQKCILYAIVEGHYIFTNLALSYTLGCPTIAEATVKGGKKKEAVVQCALEACRILDRYNLLRQSNHESRAKRQVKKWKEDDYYDSDEDEFLDRTGTIAIKRQKRMQMENEETNKPVVDTFESLQEKYAKLELLVKSTEMQLKKAIEAVQEEKKLQETNNDDLDAFMDQLQKTQKYGGKEQVSKLRQLLQSQQTELKRLEKLVSLAKPTELPKLQLNKSTSKSVMIGKRFGFGKSKNLRTIETKPHTISKDNKVSTGTKKISDEILNDKLIEEVESDKKIKQTDHGKVNQTKEMEFKKPETTNMAENKKPSSFKNERENKTEKRETETQFSPELQMTEIEETEKLVEKKKRKRRPNKDTSIADNVRVPGDYESSLNDDKYATWVPPENQSGDGRTSLNDKYGY